MSTNRPNNVQNRQLKSTLAPTRTLDRGPLTPRLAVHGISNASSVSPRHTPVSTPRIKREQETGLDATVSSDNVTPRSAKRMSRVESSNTTPTQTTDSPSFARANTISPLALSGDSVPSIGGLSMSRPTVVRSPVSDTGVIRAHAPFVRSPAGSETRLDDGIDTRFFHASDIGKVEPEPRRVEPKRSAAFFYADGQQEQKSGISTRTTSPMRSEKRLSSTGRQSYIDSLGSSQTAKSTPMLSPALSTISSTSPFFASAAQIAMQKPRSPSPSKENIHLSYRKGASQIFGSRPSPIPAPRPEAGPRRPSLQRTYNTHKKSPSLSSIDSGLSQHSRRQSTTIQETQPSPPSKEQAVSEEARHSSPTSIQYASIDTSLDSTGIGVGPLSPSKSISELAADARRERKVLDLEISNSSLLAINASLEREVRRQKTELKRFRRLSRAGRFSSNPLDARRGSGSLGVLSEDLDGLNADYAEFGRVSGLSDLYDDMSDSDDGSSLASGDIEANSDQVAERLAKDERRLRADLDKHRELLVQSQMMNQSLRRCMYATEEMIKEGKRAVDYKVRVSDIKLGGRILTGHEHEDGQEPIEVEDDFDTMDLASPLSNKGFDDHAHDFVELWGAIGKLGNGRMAGRTSIEESESADRDSGIEIEQRHDLATSS